MRGKLHYLYGVLLSSFSFLSWVCLGALLTTAAVPLSISDMTEIQNDLVATTQVLQPEQMIEIKAGWLKDQECDIANKVTCEDLLCRCAYKCFGWPISICRYYCWVVEPKEGRYLCKPKTGKWCDPNAYSRICGYLKVWKWEGPGNPTSCYQGNTAHEEDVYAASCAK